MKQDHIPEIAYIENFLPYCMAHPGTPYSHAWGAVTETHLATPDYRYNGILEGEDVNSFIHEEHSKKYPCRLQRVPNFSKMSVYDVSNSFSWMSVASDILFHSSRICGWGSQNCGGPSPTLLEDSGRRCWQPLLPWVKAVLQRPSGFAQLCGSRSTRNY